MKRSKYPVSMLKTIHNLLTFFVVFTLVTLSCTGGIESASPTGFGIWAEDCSGIVVAVNQYDFDSRMFANHSTNERYDLHVCDSNGTIVKTLFISRIVNGSPSSVDSMYYNKSAGYILLYSRLYGTGKIYKEKVTLPAGTVEVLEVITAPWNLSPPVESNCDGKCIRWNTGSNWIEIKR